MDTTPRVTKLAEAIRTRLGGTQDEHDALTRILELTQEANPAWSRTDVQRGLVKLAEDILDNPVTRQDPEGGVARVDQDALLDALSKTINGTQYAASLRGELPGWQQGKR